MRNAAGEALDRGIILWFPGPASYTGEDMAELHVHGGRAVMRAVAQALMDAGARPAEPGEFTRRAYLHGKMDLLEAEGVADLIAADTEAQRKAALAQVAGGQSAVLVGWAERLRRVLAFQEALIDFPEEDLPASVESDLVSELTALASVLLEAAEAGRQAARVRDGVVIAVTGPPNVGKSSLVNRLVGRDVAITSPWEGTTRDALEAWSEFAGFPVCFVDTAGLRETDDPVEAEGVRRASERAAQADLVLHVADAASAHAPGKRDGVYVANKVDVSPAPAGWIGVSALTGEGLDTLRQSLADHVIRLTSAGGALVLRGARHESALREASQCLDRARFADLPELRGEEVRLAMGALGRITGSVGVEDVLDTVFGAFCIGK
jgi:tRNA modification GTPase